MKQNVLAGAVVVAVLIGAAVIVSNKGNDDGMEASPSPSASASPRPSGSSSPSPSASAMPRRSGTPTPKPSATVAPSPTATPSPTPADVAGTLGFSASSYSVDEDEVTATITVSRTVGTKGEVSVRYDVSDGTAQSADYMGSSGTLTLGAGVSSRAFTVNITNDTMLEGNETVLLHLSNVEGGATLGTASSTLVIVDDESQAD